MLIYTDDLGTADVRAAFAESLGGEGVYLELHGPMKSRKRSRRFVVKLSADAGRDRWGTKRRWANSGVWGAATATVREPLGEKAATFDEWGVFIAALFTRDPGAIVGQYDSPDELRRAWAEPVIA